MIAAQPKWHQQPAIILTIIGMFGAAILFGANLIWGGSAQVSQLQDHEKRIAKTEAGMDTFSVEQRKQGELLVRMDERSKMTQEAVAKLSETVNRGRK